MSGRGSRRSWRERRARPSRRSVVEAGEQVADAFDLVVGGAEVLLVIFGDADGAAAFFVGQVGEGDEIEELVDQFDDGAVLGELVRDGVGDAVGRDEDGGDARTLIERRPAASWERTRGGRGRRGRRTRRRR
jgi:hypothetical protein